MSVLKLEFPMRAIIVSLALLLVTSLVSPASMAQSKKELAAQNAELVQRLERLESRLLTGDPAAEALMSRVDAIETSNRNLTGEVERLRFERDNLRAEVKALADDVRTLQEQSTKFNIHLDAVELVAKQSLKEILRCKIIRKAMLKLVPMILISCRCKAVQNWQRVILQVRRVCFSNI